MPTTDPILSAIRAESDTTAEERADFWHNLLTVAVESAAKDTVAHRELLDAVRAERDLARADREAAESESTRLRGELLASRATLNISAAREVIAERDALRAKVAELEAERTEWIAAAVGVGAHVGHLGPVAGGGTDEISPREWIWYAQRLGGMVKSRIDALESRPALTVGMVARVLPHAVASTKGWVISQPMETATAIVEALGHVTLLPAQDRAEELAPAADVFAGVSEGDIACIAANAHRECIDGSPWMAVARAVLDMLRVKLVAALEPDAARRLALAIHAAADAAEES